MGLLPQYTYQGLSKFLGLSMPSFDRTSESTNPQIPDPQEEYNSTIDSLRSHEFPQLSECTYLDHAAMTPYSKTLIEDFASEMTGKKSLFGNPHSDSQSSQLTSGRIDNVRLRSLQFFGAEPEDYHLVFTSNTTAAIKLVADAFRGCPSGFRFAYHQDSHTSVVGMREESVESTCLSSPETRRWIAEEKSPFLWSNSALDNKNSPILFSYPAQSNMSGRRYPRRWACNFRSISDGNDSNRIFTLLDAAAYAATSPVQLGDSETAPDFTVVSFTKIFGFPDLAALVVRRQAAEVFQWRKYFGGGTVDMVVCLDEQWHSRKSQQLYEQLEDGTLPVHSIIALDAAFDAHAKLFCSMEHVASHTRFLAGRLYSGLANLRHGNGEAVCVMYSGNPTADEKEEEEGNGPMVAFNVVSEWGKYLSPSEFDKVASAKRFEVRTGSLCNPGGVASALGLQSWEMRRNFSAGLRCGKESDLVGGKPAGMIRASVGAASTLWDVEKFVQFVNHFFRSGSTSSSSASAPASKNNAAEISETNGEKKRKRKTLVVQDLYIYPIKSCGAFRVPDNTPWDVRLEGLAWDREWALLHKGTGQALSQKRHPQMCLLRPNMDLQQGHLRVSFAGKRPPNQEDPEITIPLANNPALFKRPRSGGAKGRFSRVCGDDIHAMVYASPAISSFFSSALGIPCELARFPPSSAAPELTGRQRLSKARIQKHQPQYRNAGFESENGDVQEEGGCERPRRKKQKQNQNPILLANESAMLLVHQASVDALNADMKAAAGGSSSVSAVSPRTFRANVVVGCLAPAHTSNGSTSSPTTVSPYQEPDLPIPNPYEEDSWSSLTISGQRYAMAGSCRRCQMVCVDQDIGERGDEPLATLSRMRRFNGKIFFGVHMHLDNDDEKEEEEEEQEEKGYGYGGGGSGSEGKQSHDGVAFKQSVISVGDLVDVEYYSAAE